MDKLQLIYDGWKNLIFLSPEVENIAKKRAEICAGCPFAVESKWLQVMGKVLNTMEGLVCSKCNCPISAKIRSIKESCGDAENPKW